MTLVTLARQVARDVWRDLGWIVLYGVLMSCAAYALVLMAVNHALVADKGAATELFLERGAQTVTLSDVPAQAAGGASGEGAASEEAASRDTADLLAFFDEALVEDGVAGSVVYVPGALGYDVALVFLGAYADLPAYERDRSAPVSFAVSRDLAGEVPGALELDGARYPLDVVGPDFGIPYPGYYEGPELVEANYRNALFVFCPSYRLACELIGELRSTDALSGPLQRIVLFDPSPQDVARFRGAVLDATGLYARMAAFALIYQALPTCLTLAAMAGLVSVRAVEHVSLDLAAGESVAIVGPSGSGKSTLLSMMGLLLPPDSGTVLVGGRNAGTWRDAELCRFRNRTFGYVFQDFALLGGRDGLRERAAAAALPRRRPAPGASVAREGGRRAAGHRGQAPHEGIQALRRPATARRARSRPGLRPAHRARRRAHRPA